ncbi:MAG: PDZ domain-containing protein [Deltaproteobacteria bacterium]|nr:PDZ domain-containing protein [Deltaproteobacteria bacterium]
MTARYRIIFILVAITTVSYLSVNIFYRVLHARLSSIKINDIHETAQTRHNIVGKPPLNSYRFISQRNLFSTVEKAGAEIQINVEELEKTKLNLELLGTVFGDGKNDFAVIEEKDKKNQGLFRVGDSIASAEVIKILRGTVVLRVNGRDEVLAMKEEEPGEGQARNVSTERSGGSIKVDKTEVDQAFKNMNQLLTQVRIRPYFSSGKPDGFMVSNIQQGSIFQKMGLRSGDVIKGVNDRPITSADDMLELYKGLQSGSEINLNIKRRGKEETLTYVFR